jgi:hypothetical protein
LVQADVGLVQTGVGLVQTGDTLANLTSFIPDKVKLVQTDHTLCQADGFGHGRCQVGGHWWYEAILMVGW